MVDYSIRVDVPYSGQGFAVRPFSVEIAGTFTAAQAAAFMAAPTVPPGARTLFETGMPVDYPRWALGDTFAVGDIRTHDGRAWRAVQSHTANDPAWEPPNVPALWELIPRGAEWEKQVAYALPATCTYQGRIYKLIQSHTAQANWRPPNVPALWQDIGESQGVPDLTRAQYHAVALDSFDYDEVVREKEQP